VSGRIAISGMAIECRAVAPTTIATVDRAFTFAWATAIVDITIAGTIAIATGTNPATGLSVWRAWPSGQARCISGAGPQRACRAC